MAAKIREVRSKIFLSILFVFVFFLFLSPSKSYAQYGSNNTVSGNVFDPSVGAGVAGADIAILGISSQTTGPGGNYSFPGVPNGTHTVFAQPPVGYGLCGPGSKDVTLTGSTHAVVDFCMERTYAISGTVFEDLDLNAVQNTTSNGVAERGISGVVVTLSSGDQTTTDANGNYTFPAVLVGTYNVTASIPTNYVSNSTDPAQVTVGPDATANFSMAPLPFGNQDGTIDNPCSTSGWAFSAENPSTSLVVHVYRDGPAGTGVLIGGYNANTPRPDVNAAFPQYNLSGNHGFNITFDYSSGLFDNTTHSLYVYAIDPNNLGNPLIGSSPKNITCHIPIGNHEATINSTCTTTGWAFDPNNPSTSIFVHVYKDGPAGGGGTFVGQYTTSSPRPDVNAAFPQYSLTGNHGFNITFDSSSGLFTGTDHPLYIYAIDPSGIANLPINNTGLVIRCGLKLSGTVYDDTAGNSCASGATPFAGANITTYSGATAYGSGASNGSGLYTDIDTGLPGARTAVISNIPGYHVSRVNFDSAGWTTTGLTGYSYGPFDLSANHTLDYCISNVSSWTQVCNGGDVRDVSFVDKLPVGQDVCQVPYNDPNNPPICFSSAFNSNFGFGACSPQGWSINDEYSYNDDSKNANGLFSYTFFINRARVKGVNVTTINNSTPGVSNCADPASACTISGLQSGLYKVDGNLSLTSYTHTAGTHVTLLVNGDATLKSKISIPVGVGNLFVIAAKHDIIVDPLVGEDTTSSTATDLEGIYTAERNITLQGTKCADSVTPDKRLNMAGTVVTNSVKPFVTGGSGTLDNQRSLCLADEQYPAFSIKFRPDFVTQLTDFYKIPLTRWHEVQP